ncbi:unnamed protein product [Blumeria hordei]|uniref:SGNH hydrolase-type esterase domain-containing protein n=1 Tax=Blumeria hordei TaxID=2867405 RepID=A0A383UX12_BLUHO|nr:unnamed protein product [Blumeria hordei]
MKSFQKTIATCLVIFTVLFLIVARRYHALPTTKLTGKTGQIAVNFLKHHSYATVSSVSLMSSTPSDSAQLPNLRILPLGDSITYGYRSTSGDGYRAALFGSLNSTFPSVKYIGTQHSGSMENNANEGHPGYMIHDIAKKALPSLSQQPNVILMMAGTNDIARPYMPEDAPWRLGALIDFAILTCPFSVVIVAQLAPVTEPPEAQFMIRTFNAKIPAIVAERQKVGKKVLTVDMSQKVSGVNLYDGVHPNDYGYDLIAKVWYEGIQEAVKFGWIWEPITLGHHGAVVDDTGPDGSVLPSRPVVRDGRTCEICV